MHPSYRPITKQVLMAPTSHDRHLTLSANKKNTKWSGWLTTDVMDGPEGSNTWSNGKDTPKATIHGSQLTPFTRRAF